MDTWFELVLIISLVAEPVIVQRQELLACRTARDVTGGSGVVQVGMDTQLVQVLVIP